MPAGHSWPPHPEVKSSWSFSGGDRRSEKLIVLVAAALYVGRGARSSPRVRGDGSGEEDRRDIVNVLFDWELYYWMSFYTAGSYRFLRGPWGGATLCFALPASPLDQDCFLTKLLC